jgi:hypothetical protein
VRLFGDEGVGFDLDLPGGVEQGGDDDHGGGGPGDGEELAVDAAHGLPVAGAGEVDAGAVDVLDGAAGLFEGGSHEGEALVGLIGDIGFIGSDGAGSGDVDVIADADGAGEANDGLVGAGAGDVLAMAHGSWMRRSLDKENSGDGFAAGLGAEGEEQERGKLENLGEGCGGPQAGGELLEAVAEDLEARVAEQNGGDDHAGENAQRASEVGARIALRLADAECDGSGENGCGHNPFLPHKEFVSAQDTRCLGNQMGIFRDAVFGVGSDERGKAHV